MQSNLLQKLYIDELRDLYSAENQLVKALPKMAKAASASGLRGGFEEHLEQTKEHVARLEKIFQDLDESPKGKTCKGMEGLIKAIPDSYVEGMTASGTPDEVKKRVQQYRDAGVKIPLLRPAAAHQTQRLLDLFAQ